MVYNKIDELAFLLKSISHPIRLKILCLLQNKELSVSEIREAVETSGANITQHLNILRNQGVINYRKDANFIYNRIADERIIELMKTMQTLFCSKAAPQPSNQTSGDISTEHPAVSPVKK